MVGLHGERFQIVQRGLFSGLQEGARVAPLAMEEDSPRSTGPGSRGGRMGTPREVVAS